MSDRPEIEVISQGSIPQEDIDKEAKKAWRSVAAILVALLVISLSVYALYDYITPEDEAPPGTEDLKATITLTRDISNVGEDMKFSGFKSTGKIERYLWDFDAGVDSDYDGNSRNDVNAKGMNVTHAFDQEGDYRVTLTIEGDLEVYGDDNYTRKTYTMISVGYYSNLTGQSISAASIKEYTFDVKNVIEAERVYVVIVYPTGSLPRNDLSVYIYDANNSDGAQPIADSDDQDPDDGDTQCEDVSIESRYLADTSAGTWRAEVLWKTGKATQPIRFDIELRVYY